MHFWVFHQIKYKGEIQLHDAGGEACTYIKQITTKKKGICIEFYLFKIKYLGSCVRLY
jgi:hypothetical protein